MTEEEWLTATDPTPMLEFLRDGEDDRRLRLFAVSCCQKIWHLLGDDRSKRAVTVAEMFAEGKATFQKLSDAFDEGEEATDELFRKNDVVGCNSAAAAACTSGGGGEGWKVPVAHVVSNALSAWKDATGHSDEALRGELVRLLRDIFGNPFRPVTVDPDWLTTDVAALARGIYDERVFDRMPILADALQDAGCDNDDILNHCRDASQVHVRGCWVIDLLTGRE